jgi:hypothetical protein
MTDLATGYVQLPIRLKAGQEFDVMVNTLTWQVNIVDERHFVVPHILEC